jgi:phage/plasmid-like protein (TIGR03299 family)
VIERDRKRLETREIETMAHNLNQTRDGSYAYIGRQSAWHKLGIVTGRYMTWQEIQSHDGLNFEVVKQQLFSTYLGVAPYAVEAWGTFRADTRQFLGAVGSDYAVIQHAHGFEMLDALVGEQNGAHYETAGVLGNGEVVWGLIDLNMALHVGGDRIVTYLLFSTAHDGTKSHNYRIVSERVVCNNTLDIALAERTAASLTVRHTKNAGDRLVDIHKTLAGMRSDTIDMEQRLNFLASRRVTKETLTTIIDRLFPARADQDGNKKPDSTRRENMIAEILARFESNDNNAFPEQRGTAYNLLNGVTEYVDHFRTGVRSGKREESAMFGTGNVLKSKALEVITLAANGMPVKETRVVSMPAASAPSLLDEILDNYVCAG